MSKLWKELSRMSSTTLTPSTSYHHQTDGQFQVVNRELEGHLKSYVGD
jgi:hypothetical protein